MSKALKSSVYISNACHLGPLSFIIFVLTLLNDPIYVHPNRNIILERTSKIQEHSVSSLTLCRITDYIIIVTNSDNNIK